MQELFNFLYRRRSFFTFVLLELLALWLVFNQNSYQHFAYLSTSNRAAAIAYAVSSDTEAYFNLSQNNDSLARENARLRSELANLRSGYASVPEQTTFRHIPARIINNSVFFTNNYLTLDKGRADGIEPGMGVMTPNGVVGKIKAASEHFSTAYSVLHGNMSVSAMLKATGHICSVKWDGSDYTLANVINVAMHVPVAVGDTVVTSGINTVFPPLTPIGIVQSVEKGSEEIFQTITVRLSADFASMDHVYVVQNRYASEKDSLERVSQPDGGLMPE